MRSIHATNPPPPRLAIVLSHPTQYYCPWFRWLRNNTNLEFRVFFLWDFGVKAQTDAKFNVSFTWDTDLLSGYDNEFVPNIAVRKGTEHFWGLNNPALTERLEEWAPGAILLFGYKYWTHLRLAFWAKRRGIPLVFRGDSHLLGRERMGLLSGIILRTVYAQFAALTYVGAANKAYFQALGVPEHKLFFAPHAVDADHFGGSTPRHSEEALALRVQLGIPKDAKVLLFAGKFQSSKQPLALLRAFKQIPTHSAHLVFVGDGAEKKQLLAEAHGRSDIHFLPFANQSEMPSRYAMADIFVLPSCGFYETWGLAVNEAMLMGVPCLVSDRVGCQRDLVTDGVTGWVFSCTEPHGLITKLKQAIDSDLTGFRKAAQERVSHYSFDRSAQGLLQALSRLQRAQK